MGVPEREHRGLPPQRAIIDIMGKQKIMARQGGENIQIMDIECTLVSFGMNMVTRWHE